MSNSFQFQQTVLKVLSNVNIDSNTGCHIYLGNIDSGVGYGRVQIDGVRYNTHRLSAFMFLGLDLNNPKEFACHRCSNRACHNPDHLYVGTNQQNQRDEASGTCKFGHAIEGSNIVWHRRKSGIYFRHCRKCHNEATRRNRKTYNRKKG